MLSTFISFFAHQINVQVRPIFDILNKTSGKYFSKEEKFSVDEMMVPYFGRHSSKQFIRGKPIRYGFKIWSLCTSTGAGVWYEPYCGRDTKIVDEGLGQGPNVVVDLVSKAQLMEGSEVFMDNLFTSFPLLTKLSEMGIAGTGTVRQNRLNKVPIIKKKELEKKKTSRGSSHTVFRNDQVLVAWKDNKGVYMASNKHGADVSQTCKRFCREKRVSIQVPIPAMVTEYNTHMGGVDLLDNMVACYRSGIRIKKWWFPFYTWSLSVSAVNAWRLRRKVTGKMDSFLDFLRELVVIMLETHGKPALATGPKRPSLSGARFDRLDHLIVGTEIDKKGKPSRRNCKQCHLEGKKEMKTVYKCEKCDAPLHTHCFKKYHSG